MANRSTRTQPRTVPTQERSRETLECLLAATEDVAGRVGFDDATTKEIARVAGVSSGTLYRYFPSKEALLKALVGRKWEQGLMDFGAGLALVRSGSFDQIIRDIVGLVLQMIAKTLEALGNMRIETNNVLHFGADQIEGAVSLVRGALERRRADLVVTDLEVASVIIARSVVFLGRVGVRDYAELVNSGRYADEIAAMVSRYLTGHVRTSDAKPAAGAADDGAPPAEVAPPDPTPPEST